MYLNPYLKNPHSCMLIQLAIKKINCDFYIAALPRTYIYNAYQSHFPIFYRIEALPMKDCEK